jgi:hypothetical protein
MHVPSIRIAIAATAIALIAAGSAHAEPKTSTPAKKGCSIQFQGPGAGQSIEYPDGYSMSVKATDGKTHTYTCNDGTWKETVAIVAAPASVVPVGGIGTWAPIKP